MSRYTAVYGFPESAEGAARLAAALDVPCHIAGLHRFPDGESLVRLPHAVERAVVYRSLDRPNDKLVELLLAASVLRRQGAESLCLVAPYMAYMRQDAVFRPGEPVSQTVVGALLAQHFDRFVCVEPHLHRTHQLDEVFPGRPAAALSGAGVIAAHLAASGVGDDTVIAGPDEESEPLVRGIAEPLGLRWVVGRKVRRGDRDVSVDLPAAVWNGGLAGRRVMIADDVISSGETIIACAAAVRAAGGTVAGVYAVHALFGDAAQRRFAETGIPAVLSADGVPHASNAMGLAGVIAGVLKG